MDAEMNNIIIIVPVYNEQKYIAEFMEELYRATKRLPQIDKVIFVNDGSTDLTLSILKKHKSVNTLLVSLPRNLGKGAALKAGIKAAQSYKPEGVIFMDGDRQHDPSYLDQFIEELEDSPIVLGYRLLDKHTPWLRRAGNVVAKFIIRTFFGGIKRRDL